MPAWPASLPQAPLARGYREAFGDTTLRSQMDAGPDKLRRRFTAGVDNFTTLLRLTTAQAATLEGFYKTDTAGGALDFTWLHPRTAAAVSFRFVGAPKLSAINRGMQYQAEVKLEILP